MSVTSLSFTFVNTYAPQSAKSAPAAERPSHCDHAESAPVETQRPGGRQNRLVEAMMSALRELGLGSQTASPAAAETSPSSFTPVPVASAQAAPAEAVTTNEVATATPATAATADAQVAAAAAEAQAPAEPAVTVESAVRQFAYELFSALRQVGRGESSSDGSGRVEGEGGRRHHHGHHGQHGWRNHGYGDMSQRLDALAQTFAAQAPAAASAPASAVEGQEGSLISSSVSITLTVQDGQADAPVQAATTAAAEPAAANVPAEPAAAAVSTAAATPAKNPLLEAFSKLFNALKPQAAAAPETDMASKLRTFLQSLAQSMKPETMSTIQTPQVGGLVNVTA